MRTPKTSQKWWKHRRRSNKTKDLMLSEVLRAVLALPWSKTATFSAARWPTSLTHTRFFIMRLLPVRRILMKRARVLPHQCLRCISSSSRWVNSTAWQSVKTNMRCLPGSAKWSQDLETLLPSKANFSNLSWEAILSTTSSSMNLSGSCSKTVTK